MQKIKFIHSLLTSMVLILISLSVLNNSETEKANAVTNLPALETNLFTNAGFESGNAGVALPSGWSVTTDAKHAGSYSLKNTNSTNYPSFTIAASPGDYYEFSAWIKTSNVVCGGVGGSIMIKWGNAGGELDGYYPMGLSGTKDWQKIVAHAHKTDLSSTYVKFMPYLEQGCSGTVWYDDISVVAKDGFMYGPMMTYPNYRNTILPGKPKNVRIHTSSSDTARMTMANAALEVNVMNTLNQAVKSLPRTDIKLAEADYDIDVTSLSAGSYQVSMKLYDKTSGNIYKQNTVPLKIAATTDPLPKVYIDEFGRTVKDGKLFFPLGMYGSDTTTATIDFLSAAKFNSYMSYGLPWFSENDINSKLAYALSKGVYVNFSMQDTYSTSSSPITSWTDARGTTYSGVLNVFKGYINTFKNNPAILSWYINDELDINILPELQEHYDWMAANDYNHPGWQTLYLGQDVPSFVSNSDILGIDNYPVCSSNPPQYSSFTTSTERVRNAAKGSRGIWMVPEVECDDWAEVIPNRSATVQEMMNYAYQGIIHGSRALYYYSYENIEKNPNFATIKTDLTTASASINKLFPVALGLDAEKEQAAASSNTNISTLTRWVDTDNNGSYESLYLMAVNPSSATATSTITLGSNITAATATVGAPGENLGTVNLTNNALSVSFAPLATKIYKINFSEAKVNIKKSASESSVPVGQNINYQIEVSNWTPNNATNLSVTDALPANLSYVSGTATTGGSNGITFNFNSTTRALTWQFALLNKFEKVILNFKALTH